MKSVTASVAETLTQDLALRIMRGELQPGTSIPGENELAVQYNVSRTSVRNALQVLGAKGMLTIQAKRRSTVAPREQWSFLDADVLSWLEEIGIDDALIEQLMITRLIFEPNAAAMAAINASGRDLADLEDAWEIMSQGQQQDSAELFKQGDLAFHTAILKAGHNPFLFSVGNALSAAMLFSFKRTLEPDVTLTLEAVDAHRELMECIRLKQPEQARQQMRHILLSAAKKHLGDPLPERLEHFLSAS
ncbi:FCD domain-containing protein [Atlantibacter hermannii]|uniref:FadR/GntR family transcriptional regulator n=1 Tax=Atlantibacter hermannii TaxID=565 RepID=UPI001377E263|nr:FadR/GntR family transcriptional regulator [Atlantibacter hermannii]NBC98388.1 FCD domain-containing protein [Atlantibacter hermannii]